jgi:nitrate reductase NapE component
LFLQNVAELGWRLAVSTEKNPAKARSIITLYIFLKLHFVIVVVVVVVLIGSYGVGGGRPLVAL